MGRSTIVVLALLAFVAPRLAVGQATGTTATTHVPVKNQEVKLAPEADLINGVDDIDPSGNCVVEVKKYCGELTAGEGRLANCLSDQIAESESVDSEEGTDTISDSCREDVYQYKILRNTNINLNVPLAKACKIDAEKFCNVSWFFGYKTGQVISCLRDIKDRLAPACQRLVFRVQMDAAEDYRADVQLYEACKADAETLCKDVKLGGGRVQACLRDHRKQLSWPCDYQLFRQESENADDVRLSVRLFANCVVDKRKFCQDIEPGAARVKDCLEANRHKPTFSKACKEEVDGMIERRVRDFRLDSRLRTSCADDIYSTCAFFGDIDTVDNDDSSVIRCLQDYVEELTNPTCKQQVRKYQELAAEDIRFDVPLADACYQDRQSYCSNVPPGSARVIRCLMKMREKLSSTCRAVLFDEEVRFSQNIDFQYPMKQACLNEIKLFCKDVPHGEARVIHCLQENKYQKDFSKECKEEVRAYEMEAASDYRLNYRLSKSCKTEIDKLCSTVCKAEEGQVCAGSVLRCLTDHRAELQSDACKQEVLYFQKMEVTDYRNDVILAAACRADVDKLCANIEPGEGRVHECLRAHRTQLSDSCRKEELLLEEMEAENVELRPGIMRVCKDERLMFCKGVQPGGARMFRCLAEKMGDMDFGEACRNEVTAKLQRRQANWKLDPPLRKACRSAVKQFCLVEDQQQQEKALVYKCLIHQYDELDAGCQKELGRAMHMAFFVWSPGALLTSDCDEDVQALCLSRRPNMDKTPGAVGTCLATILDEMSDGPGPADPVATGADVPANIPRVLSTECRVLADIAQPPDMKKAFDASLSMLMLKSQLGAVESATGVQMLNRDRLGNARSVTLTGWTALAGVTSLLILIVWGIGFAWQKYRGVPTNKDYTLVVKKTHK